MEYKLVKKHPDIKRTETISTFHSNVEITQFYYSQPTGFLFITQNAISRLDELNVFSVWCGDPAESGYKNVNRKNALLTKPSSFFLHPNKYKLYICEDNGRSIRIVNLKTDNVSSVLKAGAIDAINKEFKKSATYDGQTGIAVDNRDNLYWASEIANKCFLYKSPKLRKLMGTGARGFSNATTLSNSMIDRPKGLAYEKGALYLLDSGNHCVRQIKSGSKIVFSDESENLRNIVCSNSSVYVLAEHKVFHFTPSTKAIVAYQSDNIVDISSDKDGNLYILEEVQHGGI